MRLCQDVIRRRPIGAELPTIRRAQQAEVAPKPTLRRHQLGGQRVIRLPRRHGRATLGTTSSPIAFAVLRLHTNSNLVSWLLDAQIAGLCSTENLDELASPLSRDLSVVRTIGC